MPPRRSRTPPRKTPGPSSVPSSPVGRCRPRLAARSCSRSLPRPPNRSTAWWAPSRPDWSEGPKQAMPSATPSRPAAGSALPTDRGGASRPATGLRRDRVSRQRFQELGPVVSDAVDERRDGIDVETEWLIGFEQGGGLREAAQGVGGSAGGALWVARVGDPGLGPPPAGRASDPTPPRAGPPAS